MVCTQGMAAALQQRLESLSGYRHVFSPQDPSARLNPVLCCALSAQYRGQAVPRFVADMRRRAGPYAADQQACAPRGARSAGIAARRPGLAFGRAGLHAGRVGRRAEAAAGGRRGAGSNSADGTPPASGYPVPATLVCRAWQQAAGDAGWGGALAESALANRAAVIVFRGNGPVAALGRIAGTVAARPPLDRDVFHLLQQTAAGR